ncbi:hypothetical protein B0H19DRAFT_1104620 [Mycena capillaripes]|nr:hypothetical protein B0H19DRAFT_1104620 [Mycena capillaripes]
MATPLNFPPELHDLVIDHMHDQKQALGTFGLVSKSWLCSSRHHLFASVALRDGNWKLFVQLLDSPLATFPQSIESLTISVSDFDAMEPGASFNELFPLLRGVPALRSLLPEDVLREFPRLRRLRLENVYWAGVTDTTTNHVLAAFPNIKELDLHLVTFPTPRHMTVIVSRFSQLQKVSMNPQFLWDGPAFNTSDYPQMPYTLQHLRLRLGLSVSTRSTFTEVAHWFHAGDGPPAIRALELGILDAQSLPSVGNLLRALGPELHDLDLKLMYHVTADDIKTHIDLSQNPNVHRLTIHLSLRRFQVAPNSLHAPWALLAMLHSPISTLTIVLSIDFLELIDNLDWAHLNNALGTSPQLAKLRRLHFMVHCGSVMDGIVDAIRTRVQEYDARGIVEVSLLQTSRVFTHGI